MKNIIAAILFLFSFSYLSAQLWDWGLGVSAVATPQTLNFGAGARALIMLDDDVVGIAPQFSYMPGIFKTVEWYAGGHLQYDFRPYKKIGVYAILGGYYNQHDQNTEHRVDDNDWSVSFEPGIGIQRNNGCARPFVEARYNTNWKEAHLHVGFLFMYGDCFPKKYCSPADNPMN